MYGRIPIIIRFLTTVSNVWTNNVFYYSQLAETKFIIIMAMNHIQMYFHCMVMVLVSHKGKTHAEDELAFNITGGPDV